MNGGGIAFNFIRADVSLPWDPGDLGTYCVSSTHSGTCTFMGSLGWANTFACVASRQLKWVVKIWDSGNQPMPLCLIPGAMKRERHYAIFDDMGQWPTVGNANWTMTEVVDGPNCGMITGGSGSMNIFEDFINNCQAGCTFQSRQYFTVTSVKLDVKEAANQAAHKGWHVIAIPTNVTVTTTDTPRP